MMMRHILKAEDASSQRGTCEEELGVISGGNGIAFLMVEMGITRTEE